MIGFTAEYESGDIKLQDEELCAGAFFDRDNLPEIPRKMSLARTLIDDWINQ
jgi:NAD+ diphosphatase